MTVDKRRSVGGMFEEAFELIERIGLWNTRNANRHEETSELLDWLERARHFDDPVRYCTADDLGLPPRVVSQKDHIQSLAKEVIESAFTRVHIQHKGETISVWVNFYDDWDPMGWVVIAISGDPLRGRQEYDRPGYDYDPQMFYEQRPKSEPVKQCPGCKMAIYDQAARDGWCTNCNPDEP